MKTKTMLKLFSMKVAFFILLATLTIVSCKKSETQIKAEDAKTKIDGSIIAKIKDMGFQTTGIKEFGNYFVVEDDIMISKESLLATKNDRRLLEGKGKISQAHTDSLIKSNNGHNINVQIDESIWGNHVWYSGVLQAVETWNSTPNCNVKLNLWSDSYNSHLPNVDIIIRGDQGTLPSNVAAQAEFPTMDGKPGGLILVNSDFRDPNTNYFINPGQGAWNVIHEIGHSLGLRHTNWYFRGEGVQPYGANDIPNTPNSLQGDPNSVMNGGTALSSYNTYPFLPSNYDGIAISTLYPLNSNSLIVSYIGGTDVQHTNGQYTYHMSYESRESGIYYKWEVLGINGTNYYHEYTDDSDTILNEIGFSYPGTYQLKCTISGGKYTTPVTATKNITVM